MRRLLCGGILLLTLAGCAAPSAVGPTPSEAEPAPAVPPTPRPQIPGRAIDEPDWLARLNDFREQAGAPPVTENTAWSAAATNHAATMAMTGRVEGAEIEQSSPYFSVQGSEVGSRSMLYGGAVVSDATRMIDHWMRRPLRAFLLIDPAVQQAGFGSATASGETARLSYASALDLGPGHGAPGNGAPSPGAAARVWPRDGGELAIASGGSDDPDVVSTCPGYSHPTGPPIYLLLGPNTTVGSEPVVTSLTREGEPQAVEHCLFDGSLYNGRSTEETAQVRERLASHGVDVLLPRQPLQPGATYAAFIRKGDQVFAWRFRVAADAT